MKKQLVDLLTKFSLLGAMVLVTTVAPTQGQSLAYRIKANIPFGFSIGDKELPSGKYSIGRANQNSDDIVLAITDVNGRSKALQMSSSIQTWRVKDRPTLVFHRYGDQYFLFQVWPAGERTGRQFIKSRREREIQRDVAANSGMGNVSQNAGVETVAIVGVLQ
jgi:hypothetical protein